MAKRTIEVSGDIPKGWYIMTLSETMTGSQKGNWYCCLRRKEGNAVSYFGITAQEVFNGAVNNAIAWNDLHG